ncbi:MAG: CBS domain-containing protein [Desulfobacteraceae bacterium]|nr:CBS domain-containing protein [Desulfobacteraceae bacterium]
MYVAMHMSSPAVTIREDVPLQEVREILRAGRFRHLPVVDGDGKLVGMVTDRDLRSASPSTILDEAESRAELARMARTPVRTIMSTRLVTLAPTSTLDDALFLLDREKVGAIPVVDEHQCVVGVFSIRDLIKAYRRLFGLGERGSALIAIENDNKPRLLTRIVEVLEEQAIPFTRLVQSEEDGGPGTVYLRVNTYNLRAVHAALQEAGLSVIVPRLVIEKSRSCQGNG